MTGSRPALAAARRAVPHPVRAVARAAPILLLLAGCAPDRRPVAPLDPATREQRYRVGLAGRTARAVAVDAEVLLWAEAPAGSRLPGAEARLLLAAPDAFRLRVGSLFGTALDLAGRGDSLTAYVPSRRRGLALDAHRDSLGVGRPGGLAFRALTATWRPPEPAWGDARWADSLLRVSWVEEGDTLALAVGSHGLPSWASLRRPDGPGVRIDYEGWERGSGVAWPVRLTIHELDGAFRLSCKVSRVRFPGRPEDLRLSVAIPPDAVRLTLAELRRALERLGTL